MFDFEQLFHVKPRHTSIALLQPTKDPRMLNSPGLETKATTTDEVADMMRAFEEFKATNNQALADLAARQSTDVLTRFIHPTCAATR